MTNALIFGTNDLAEIISFSVEMYKSELQKKVVGFVVDDDFYSEDTFCDFRVYRFSELKQEFDTAEVEILVAIGYGNMNQNRRAVIERLMQEGWKVGNYIDPCSNVRSQISGFGNIILDGVNIGVGCEVGNGNIFFTDSTIAHHCKIGDYNFFAIRSSLAGRVNVGDHCFFGNNCCTKDHVTIHSRTIIGAGSYLNSNTLVCDGVLVPARSTWITEESKNIRL